MAAELTLERAMSLAAECLRNNTALATAFADPLRLDLPPLPAGSRNATINAGALRAIAAMYLQANLEDAGVLAIAELIGQSRDQLRFVDAAGFQKLQPFASPPSDAYTRPQREALFARLFGLGGATRDTAANHDFERLLAALCVALQRIELELQGPVASTASRDAALRYAASALLFNLAPRQYGNTLIAARVIDRQLRQAIAALSDRSLLAQFRARDLWQVIRAIAAEETPDIPRLMARGHSGMAVLSWLGGVLARLDTPSPLVGRADPVLIAAARWLQATGLEAPPMASADTRAARAS